jgi:GT2 family glycosyltransferase
MLSGSLVSVVIVSYNARAVLRHCLQSLERDRDGLIGEVIVVDNNSSDDSREIVRAEFPSTHLICNDQNLGFGLANNQGVAVAQGRYVFLLNSDTRVNAASVRDLVSALESDPRLGLVGPRLLNADGSPQRSLFRFLTPVNLALEQLSLAQYLPADRVGPKRGRRRVAGYLKGAALLGRTDVLRAFGPFDPDYFMYCEDIDLCYRLQASGLTVRLVPTAVITHIGGQSTQQHRDKMAEQAIASTYLFYRKHYAAPSLWTAVAIIRGVSAMKWVRDATRLVWAMAHGRTKEQAHWQRQMLVWTRIGALRPPRQRTTGLA